MRDGSDKLQMNFRQKVRDNREAVLRRDVSDSHPFAGTPDASYIRLENPGCPGARIIFKSTAMIQGLTDSQGYLRRRLQPRMARNVERLQRLFEPVNIQRFQSLSAARCLFKAPAEVRVHHDARRIADSSPHRFKPGDILCERRLPHFDLYTLEALCYGFGSLFPPTP